MEANKVLLVVAMLGCLFGCTSAAEFDNLPPSGKFWKDAAKVFAPWNSFMSFKETEQTLERIVAGMESIDENKRQKTYGVELESLKTMLSFNKFDPKKCGYVEDEIKAKATKVWAYENYFGRANLLPYLWVCEQRQWSFCHTFDGVNGSPGRPEDVRTRATQFPGHLASLVVDHGEKLHADWLANKLNVNAFDEKTSKQVEKLLSSETFKQALSIVYADDTYYKFEEYYAPALRQALAELSQAEKHYGTLGESLQKLKNELTALLDVCTPEPTKCPSVFDEFSKFFAKDKYVELNENPTMKEYEFSCLNDMKYYCSLLE